MKAQLTAALASALFCISLASGAENVTQLSADRVSVFKAPLVCPAAPQIGCGIASKPILLDLEKQTGVAEAWLNRAGTIIAVVWKPDANAEAHTKVATGLKDDRVVELEGTAREEEANIIAARLVRWVQAKSSLPKDKAEGLQHAFNERLRKELTGEYARLNQKPKRLEEIAHD